VNASFKNGWFITADLTGADFYGCDLSGSDFGRRYAEEGVPPFPPAILTDARMTKACLKGTNLGGVDLGTVRGLLAEQLKEAVTDAPSCSPPLRVAPRRRDRSASTSKPASAVSSACATGRLRGRPRLPFVRTAYSCCSTVAGAIEAALTSGTSVASSDTPPRTAMVPR
jgi:uncharacterized protein YjbI with pentapeptide repeats